MRDGYRKRELAKSAECIWLSAEEVYRRVGVINQNHHQSEAFYQGIRDAMCTIHARCRMLNNDLKTLEDLLDDRKHERDSSSHKED